MSHRRKTQVCGWESEHQKEEDNLVLMFSGKSPQPLMNSHTKEGDGFSIVAHWSNWYEKYVKLIWVHLLVNNRVKKMKKRHQLLLNGNLACDFARLGWLKRIGDHSIQINTTTDHDFIIRDFFCKINFRVKYLVSNSIIRVLLFGLQNYKNFN